MSLITEIFGQRSFENPATPLSAPDNWLVDLFGGGKASSGVTVNRKTALTYAPAWRAVNLMARDVAKLPFVVWKRTADGGKERAREHAAYPLLRRMAAPNVTSFIFIQTLEAHRLVLGNGYGFIPRRGDGAPMELRILDPDVTYPVRRNGVLFYVTTLNNAQKLLLPRDVLHIKGLCFDGLIGYKVVDLATDSLGGGMAMQKYGSVFFKNNATPGVVIEHPSNISKQAAMNLKESWARMFTDLDQKHGTAVLEEGMTVKPIASTAKDAQLNESRQLEVRDVGNWFGAPPHRLGDPTRRSYSSLEQENQSHLDEVDGALVGWETECYDKLIAPQEKENDSHFCEFIRAALVRADLEARTKSQVARVQAGLLSPDEARAQENLNPIPNGEGKKFQRPLNIGILGEDDSDDDPGDKDGDSVDDDKDGRGNVPVDVLDAHRQLIVSAGKRIGTRIGSQARKAAKRPDSFIDWIDSELVNENTETFADIFGPVVLISGSSYSMGELADFYFGEIREELLAAAECQPRELEGMVRDVADKLIDDWPKRLTDKLSGMTAVETAVGV